MPDYGEWSTGQKATTVTVDGHDLTVAYHEEGNGDVVLFLHGIPTNSFLWRNVIEHIATERRVLVPDMIGYGNSEKRDSFDRSLRAQEIMVDELLGNLGIDNLSFVGHDLGGGVGLRYAAHRPDAVEKLVLSNSVAYDSWPVKVVTDLALPEVARETSPEELQNILDDLFRDGLYGDVANEEFVSGMKTPWNSEEGVTSLVRNAIATNTNHTTEIDPTEISAETLLLWGAEDSGQSIEWARQLESDIPNSHLVGLDEANHWVIEDRPEAYRQELGDFLLAD